MATRLADGAWPALECLTLGANHVVDPLITADRKGNRQKIEQAVQARAGGGGVDDRAPTTSSPTLHISWDD